MCAPQRCLTRRVRFQTVESTLPAQTNSPEATDNGDHVTLRGTFPPPDPRTRLAASRIIEWQRFVANGKSKMMSGGDLLIRIAVENVANPVLFLAFCTAVPHLLTARASLEILAQVGSRGVTVSTTWKLATVRTRLEVLCHTISPGRQYAASLREYDSRYSGDAKLGIRTPAAPFGTSQLSPAPLFPYWQGQTTAECAYL
ncbi:hypothetical protein AB1N83_003624 [Pleurotus pulmonarius]